MFQKSRYQNVGIERVALVQASQSPWVVLAATLCPLPAPTTPTRFTMLQYLRKHFPTKITQFCIGYEGGTDCIITWHSTVNHHV